MFMYEGASHLYFISYGAVVQSVVPNSPAAACGIVAGSIQLITVTLYCVCSSHPPGTVICKVYGAILPCNRGSTAVFDAVKRGLEQGASSPAGVTLTVIHPHSAFPFSRSSEGSRSHAHRGKSSRSMLELSSSGNAAFSASTGGAADGLGHVGDVEIDEHKVRASASISKGHTLPSGAVDLTVKVTPLGLGFMPSKILVSKEFDCR
jgi:hypothetical protein